MAIPIFRISLSNATVLSIAYLAVAMLIEASRRWFPFRWTDRASLTVDWIPARTLDWMGLYEPIRRAVVEDRLSTFSVRMIFGATSIASIFLVALGVGTMMWVARWLIVRAEQKKGKA